MGYFSENNPSGGRQTQDKMHITVILNASARTISRSTTAAQTVAKPRVAPVNEERKYRMRPISELHTEKKQVFYKERVIKVSLLGISMD